MKTEGAKGSKIIKFFRKGMEFELKVTSTINMLRNDFKSRDFTINSLYYNVFYDEIIDLKSGVQDILNKQLVCNNDFKLTFNHSFTRFLRIMKFYSDGYSLD